MNVGETRHLASTKAIGGVLAALVVQILWKSLHIDYKLAPATLVVLFHQVIQVREAVRLFDRSDPVLRRKQDHLLELGVSAKKSSDLRTIQVGQRGVNKSRSWRDLLLEYPGRPSPLQRR